MRPEVIPIPRRPRTACAAAVVLSAVGWIAVAPEPASCAPEVVLVTARRELLESGLGPVQLVPAMAGGRAIGARVYGSGLAAAGLRDGDVVTAVDGRPVDASALGRSLPRSWRLDLLRDGCPVTVIVTVI
jgi:S1-C subfamily serine protease